jgi:peroxiredoxin
MTKVLCPLLFLACAASAMQCTPAARGEAAHATLSADVPTNAEVGKTAPDFALPDLDGHMVRLVDLRGKIVVLEWFNPECPFVRASHTKGSLKGLAKRYTDEGVAWLGVNSAAAGKEGHGVAATAQGQHAYDMKHPILIGESGDVGHRYGATNTPNMFVIDPNGTLVYRGAIDNSPDGEGESPTDGKLVNYVDEAIDAVQSGRPVTTKETRAYGCGVKY